jgi:hypothetical protein
MFVLSIPLLKGGSYQWLPNRDQMCKYSACKNRIKHTLLVSVMYYYKEKVVELRRPKGCACTRLKAWT